LTQNENESFAVHTRKGQKQICPQGWLAAQKCSGTKNSMLVYRKGLTQQPRSKVLYLANRSDAVQVIYALPCWPSGSDEVA
jgi:hypothetical protein